MTAVMAPPAMTMVTPPTRLADDRGVRRSGYGRPYAGNGSLAGACSEAQYDGAADERQRDVALHGLLLPRFRTFEVRKKERDLAIRWEMRRRGRSEDPPH